MSSRLVAFASALLLAVAGAALPQSSAQAADEIVLKYRLLERSVDVADLERFAETGELTRPLRRYIRVSGQRPEQVRETLTQEFAVSPRLLDRMLNNPIGEAALNQISEAIYPPSGQADETALRSALVLSASDDSPRQHYRSGAQLSNAAGLYRQRTVDCSLRPNTSIEQSRWPTARRVGSVIGQRGNRNLLA
jgi:hypothetical protein